MTIRPAAARDWRAIAQRCDLIVRMHHAFDRSRFLGPDRLAGEVYMSRMREETESGRAAVFVADEGDRIVGFVFAGVEDESWKEMRDAAGFVHDLIVDESHRRAGIGSALVHAALDWFGARGIARIMLWTAPPNVAAQRLFDRLGFRRTMIEMTRDSQ